MLNLNLPILISLIITLVIAFTIHEFAHAWTADIFGDNTPRSQGRLTLNPLKHLDPIGSLLLVAFGFGWARPVQVNTYTLERRSPAAPMLVALAGPLSNFLLALVISIPARAGLIPLDGSQGLLIPTLPQFIEIFVRINLVLMVFNLIPIFPLDGEKILYYFLPASGQDFLLRLRPYGTFILIGMVVLGVFGIIISLPIAILEQLLLG